MRSIILVLSFLAVVPAWALSVPNKQITPGALCSPDNPDFIEYRYPVHIAYCKRNVSHEEKEQIAAAYGGIPESEWHNYEFDHLIPLNAGGSSAPENLWPQPIAEAHEKDRLELQIYNELRDGQITQDQAVKMTWDWFTTNGNL